MTKDLSTTMTVADATATTGYTETASAALALGSHARVSACTLLGGADPSRGNG